MQISITQLYRLLSDKVGKENAENLTDYIERKVKDEVKNETRHLATKADLANVKTEMIKWHVGLFILLSLMIMGLYVK
ncbi:MAG: hypothetical protein V6Z82_00030 [Flavobacteriales bacterium]